jgi:hypothetical protein
MPSTYSGIWGMSSTTLSSEPKSLIQNLKDEGVISKRVFAFGLRNDDTSTSTSFLDIGTISLSNTKSN